MLVDPMSMDLMNAKETKAFISLLDFIETDNIDQDAADQLLVRILTFNHLFFLEFLE